MSCIHIGGSAGYSCFEDAGEIEIKAVAHVVFILSKFTLERFYV